MVTELGFVKPTETQIRRVALLLYRTRGLKDNKHEIEGITDDEIKIYRRIFENNN